MSDSATHPGTRYPQASAGERRDTSPAAVNRALSSLVGSTEPAVVFSSLVRLCAPAICDIATATVSGPDERVYAVSWPRDAVDQSARHTSVVVQFDAAALEGHAAFHGEMTMGFGSDECCQPYVSQLLVDRAMATIERERLLDAAARAQREAAHLEVALSSNREIGVAVGIVMANHGLTAADQGFDVLREVSQRTNRKLHAIALEVIRSGVLQLPTEVDPGA